MDNCAAGRPKNVNITAAVIDSTALALLVIQLLEYSLMLFPPPSALLQTTHRTLKAQLTGLLDNKCSHEAFRS